MRSAAVAAPFFVLVSSGGLITFPNFYKFIQKNMRGQRGTLPVHALWYVITTKSYLEIGAQTEVYFPKTSAKRWGKFCR